MELNAWVDIQNGLQVRVINDSVSVIIGRKHMQCYMIVGISVHQKWSKC